MSSVGQRQPAPDAASVLLVGDIEEAFLDGTDAAARNCTLRANVLDAIETVAKGNYDTVGVVMSGFSGQLAAVLRGLRRCTAARIVLLARMYEEPIARCLTESGGTDEKAADAYLICPTTLAMIRGVGCDNGAVAETNDDMTDGLPRDPGALAARIRHLEWLATTDDLTGLRNRRYIREFARQVLKRAKQNAGRVTLLLFDIDNFKHYNDKYGHPTGDEILRQAAILMRRSCRPHDVVARVGGDEFAVIFWDDPGRLSAEDSRDRRMAEAEHPTEAIFIAKRFRKEFGIAELALLGPEGRGVLTISGGLASFPRDGSTVDELFDRADEALLDAKRRGKNQIYLVGQPQNDIADI